MLKEPYELIHSEGNVRYYYLKFEDNPVTYLAAETVEEAVSIKKRWLRKPLIKNEEVTISVKLIPINALVAHVLASAYYDDPVATGEDGDTYAKWNEFDVADIEEEFSSYLEYSGDSTTYRFPHVWRNPVVKGFNKDNRDVFSYAIENHGRFSRTNWLVGRDSRGTVTLVSVEEIGKVDNSVSNIVTVFMLSRDLMKIILDDMEASKFTDRDVATVSEEDIEDGIPEGVEISIDGNGMVN